MKERLLNDAIICCCFFNWKNKFIYIHDRATKRCSHRDLNCIYIKSIKSVDCNTIKIVIYIWYEENIWFEIENWLKINYFNK